MTIPNQTLARIFGNAFASAKTARLLLDETADERIVALALEAERALWSVYEALTLGDWSV